MNQLHELFMTELADAYHAENQVLKALPKMAKAAHSPELKQAFTGHAQQTERQLERLKQVFDLFGKPPRGKRCHGMAGIIEEGKEFISDMEPGPGLDAALISAAQKVEHYELASYGSLRTWAGVMKHEEACRLLQDILDEEGITDKKLTHLAEMQSNPEALAA